MTREHQPTDRRCWKERLSDPQWSIRVTKDTRYVEIGGGCVIPVGSGQGNSLAVKVSPCAHTHVHIPHMGATCEWCDDV